MTSLQIVIFLAVIFVFWSLWQMYLLGKEDGYKDGYKKGRKEVNAHLDGYLKNGGWKV